MPNIWLQLLFLLNGISLLHRGADHICLKTNLLIIVASLPAMIRRNRPQAGSHTPNILILRDKFLDSFLEATLGAAQQGIYERFAPLIVQRVMARP